MAARVVIPTDPVESTLETVAEDLAKIFRAHASKVTRIRVEKRRQGLRDGSLPEEIECVREEGESDEDHLRSCVHETMSIITRDARRPRSRQAGGHVGAWQGTIFLLNHLAELKKQDVAHLDVRIEDPDAPMTIDAESIAVVNVVRMFMKDMCKEMVGVLGAAKDVAQANADMGVGIAKRLAEEGEHRGKYDFKIAKLRVAIEEQRMEECARLERTKVRSAAAQEIAKTYEPVIEMWSRWVMEDQKARRSGSTPPANLRPPTMDEITRVFGGDERLDPLCALAAQMIAEPSAQHRADLAQRFREQLQLLSDEVRVEVQARAVRELGEPRARECYAWLAMPITDPS